MDKRIILSILTLLIFGFGCKSPKAVSELTENDIEITMNRGGCFGKCPIYNIAIYNNGYATIEKVRFMKAPGKYDRMLSKNEYKAIKSAFKKSNFGDFKEEYETMIPDLPTITIGYNEGKGLKKVKGKDERPAKIMELQYLLEKLVDNNEWKLVEAYPEEEVSAETREKPEDALIYEEVIIEPNAGVRLPLWFKEKEEFGIRLLTRISQEQNLWLITYNTKQFKPDQILEMLKKDPSIKSAEFNKKLENRN